MAESTAVATRAASALANMEPRFVEAFGAGKLDRLTAHEQSAFLSAFGQHIGVRSELGELMIYQGKPYITIAGRVRIAHGTGLLAGVQPRPATMLERRQFGAADEEVLWVCDVYRHGAARAFKGWGVCNPTKDRNPVAKQFPREMAKKRAKYDGLALAFPPDESLGPIHARYLAEAEEAVRESVAGHQIAATSYDDTEELPEGLDGEAVAEDSTADELPAHIDADGVDLGEASEWETVEDEPIAVTVSLEVALAKIVNGQVLGESRNSGLRAIHKWAAGRAEKGDPDLKMATIMAACTTILEARERGEIAEPAKKEAA